MKLAVIFLLMLFNQILLSSSSSDRLINEIQESDILADFWSGDDGEECGEPTISILYHNTQKKLVELYIELNGSAVGCYETSYNCKIMYKVKSGNEKVFQPLNSYKDCE